jgi:CheY-like chemotaxis protein
MASLTILVIEDNQHDQFVLKHLLEKFGFKSQIKSSAEDALEALTATKYAAVLLDLSLPGMDGFACIKEMRQRELISSSRTPVIALTASIDDKVREKAMKAGMDDFIGKPFDPEELRKVLLRHVYEPAHPNLKTLQPLTAEELDQNKWKEQTA